MRIAIALTALALAIGCGVEPSGDEKPDIVINQPAPPTPLPPPPSLPSSPQWDGDVKAIVGQHCALSGCHAGQGFVRTGGAFRAAMGADGKVVRNGRMPPRSSPNYDLWDDRQRKRLLDYVAGQ